MSEKEIEIVMMTEIEWFICSRECRRKMAV